MQLPLVVVVTGAPATGKTTLGRRLASDAGLPFVAKDDIKEILFDTLGWSDRAWSRKLGDATFELLFHYMEVELRAGRSFIIESNFRPELSTSSFLYLQKQFGFRPLQIVCWTEPTILFGRYKQRYLRGVRHPGHVDQDVVAEIQTEVMENVGPMALGGEVIEVDTTDFARIDYAAMYQRVQRALNA